MLEMEMRIRGLSWLLFVENKITSSHTGPLWFLLHLFFVIYRPASNCSQNHSAPWEWFKNHCPTWTSFYSLILRSFHKFSTSWPPNNHFFNLCLVVPPTTAPSHFNWLSPVPSSKQLAVGFSYRLPVQIPPILQDLYQPESSMWTWDGSRGESGEYHKIASGSKLFLNFLYKRRTKRRTRQAGSHTNFLS